MNESLLKILSNYSDDPNKTVVELEQLIKETSIKFHLHVLGVRNTEQKSDLLEYSWEGFKNKGK